MADVSGARGTGNLATGLLKPDIASTVAELEPASAPLTVLLNRAPKDSCHNPAVDWFEEELVSRFDRINAGAGYASGITALVVDTGTKFYEHALVWVSRTLEMMRVQEVNGNTLTVVRGVGSTAAALIDNDELIIVGTAQQENDTSREARSTNPTKVTNYCQIIRTPYESSETVRNSLTWTNPQDWDRKAKVAGIEHAKSQELVLWYGKPSENTTGTQPRRTMGGFYHYVTTNTTDAGGAFTEAEFFTSLRPVFRYGNKVKTGFAAQLPVDVLNGFPRAKLQIQQGENTFGLRVMRYISPHGDLNLLTHYLFEGDTYAGHIAYVDMGNVRKRYLQNRDTHTVENIQLPGQDGRKDELLTECTVEWKLNKTHGYAYGITS